MTNPFRYRPEETTEEEGPENWEDNAISNAFAWSADTLLPKMCATPEHWSSRLTQYLWTDCPCCLLFRGMSFGFVGGVVCAAIIALTIA